MQNHSTTEPSALQVGKTPYGYSPDPCPKCGIKQADHWKCAQCQARGHAIPRDTPFSTLCRWCADDARKAVTQ